MTVFLNAKSNTLSPAGGVNTGWTYSAGNRQATRTLAGKLKPSDSAEVTIRLRLLANGATADAYTNLAEIKSAQDTTGACLDKAALGDEGGRQRKLLG